MAIDDYNEWWNKYHEKKIIKLSDYLNKNEIELLKKLVDISWISISEDGTYTGSECEEIMLELSWYTKDGIDDEETLKAIEKENKSLEDKNVKVEEYKELVKKVEDIFEEAQKLVNY